MTTRDLHPWNLMPTEILEHVFSFLPIRDRLNVTCTCNLWATAISSASVWSFTEVHCDLDRTEERAGGTSCSFLQKIQPYMGHIRYLKIVLDVSLASNRRLARATLHMMAWKSRRLQGLQIMCYGKTSYFHSGQDLLNSLKRLFRGMNEATMKHVDFRHMPFTLDNGLILSVGRCSPNLCSLLFNNHASFHPFLRMHTIIEVLRTCPKLSTLGITYFDLSRRVFQELLKPNREPFKYLELLYEGLDSDIPDDCWASMRERHPGFRVGLEFSGTVTAQKITHVLKPFLPISQLHFDTFADMADLLMLVANIYAGTLERLVLHPPPSIELNMALIRLARTCAHLKEIHCFCVVSPEVVEAFRCQCPHLKKYTLSPTISFFDNPTMVFL